MPSQRRVHATRRSRRLARRRPARRRSAARRPPRSPGSRRRTPRRAARRRGRRRARRRRRRRVPSIRTTWLARSQARSRSCRLATTAPPPSAWREQQLDEQALVGEVEVRRRLVEQQQRRVLEQRGRERDALALAAGERLHVAVGEVGEEQAAEDALDLADRSRRSSGAAPAGVAPVRERRGLAHRRRKRIGPELRAPGAPVGERRRRPVGELDAVDADRAGGDRKDAGERREQRRLAGAVRADDDPALAGGDAQVERRRRAVRLRAAPPARSESALASSRTAGASRAGVASTSRTAARRSSRRAPAAPAAWR